jgi:hypothetical protein
MFNIVRLDQPAAGEPAQHLHAYLLGDGGYGRQSHRAVGAKTIQESPPGRKPGEKQSRAWPAGIAR